MTRGRPGWNPESLRKAREALGLTQEDVGQELREISERNRWNLAANFQTLSAHETGRTYPGPHYRRAYCLLYKATEPQLGFRNPLPMEEAPMPEEPRPARPSVSSDEEAVNQALTMITAGVPEASATDFRGQVVDAWQRSRGLGLKEHPTTLTMVGGYAGSGKSELARFLGALTAWPILDKDSLTRPMVEQLLTALGGDPYDRHSELYAEKVKPAEYRCLMEAAWDNLDCGISVILDAPFVAQFSDVNWMRRLFNKCRSKRVIPQVVWVQCDTESMFEYVQFRDAPRDAWKLQNWDTYVSGMDMQMRPVAPHYLVDNRHGAAVALADRARDTLMGGGRW
ncbi:AAA family ATPase [Yinghuangia seranimata]|uniref:AAA family ATPase n=1 Tax=Yinghuangia seranimata TaxID=408067 RepID=UPI00248BBBA6|nr:AAA family ATPase [Yinghuangia seranimata]MDI2127803.1 AAA family ATPase [Yinghuangia seranimata]